MPVAHIILGGTTDHKKTMGTIYYQCKYRFSSTDLSDIRTCIKVQVIGGGERRLTLTNHGSVGTRNEFLITAR